MFRDIRRKKNLIGEAEAKALLKSARIGVLAVNGDDGYPYAVPVNYLYDEAAQKILFHGAKAGHKADAIKASDKVCFTVYGPETVRGETWAPYVKSAVVFGRCRPIDSPAETIALVKKFAAKYYPSEELVNEETERSGNAVRMFEISIEHLSGKEVQEK